MASPLIRSKFCHYKRIKGHRKCDGTVDWLRKNFQNAICECYCHIPIANAN